MKHIEYNLFTVYSVIWMANAPGLKNSQSRTGQTEVYIPHSIYSLTIYSQHWDYLISTIFADGNTILTTADNIDHLLQTLKHESELAVKWFTDNQMVVNPDKFQAMILQNSKNSKNYEPAKLEIGRAEIETKNAVKLLGITMDNKLNIEEHISEL